MIDHNRNLTIWNNNYPAEVIVTEPPWYVGRLTGSSTRLHIVLAFIPDLERKPANFQEIFCQYTINDTALTNWVEGATGRFITPPDPPAHLVAIYKLLVTSLKFK